MDIFTHITFGALVYLSFLKEITLAYILIAMLCAALPDLDIFLAPLRKRSVYFEHRGGSHSFIMGIIVSFILGLIFSPLLQLPFFSVWIVGALFYGLHVAMDLLTTTKIPYLYPLSKKEVSFYIEKAGSQFTMLNSLFLMFLLNILYETPADIPILINLINFYTFFFIGYYIIRIVTKILGSSHLNSNQKYFPGVLPFFFTIFEYEIIENTVNLVLEKKSLFSKRSLIYKKATNLNSLEMEIFEKGLSICRARYYYAKWTLLPAFIKEGGVLSVRYYFLEPLMHKRTPYIQYSFDLISKEVIGVKQFYGSILI